MSKILMFILISLMVTNTAHGKNELTPSTQDLMNQLTCVGGYSTTEYINARKKLNKDELETYYLVFSIYKSIKDKEKYDISYFKEARAIAIATAYIGQFSKNEIVSMCQRLLSKEDPIDAYNAFIISPDFNQAYKSALEKVLSEK
jgi:hypothetical protein